MSKKSDKKDDPLYCINKAEKYLNPGFFDAVFKSKRERLEDAISLYEEAAQIYIEQKEYLKSAECQLKCAWIKEQLKDNPTFSYLEALNCYKRTDNFEDYQKTLDKCISSYLKEGKYNDAAQLEYDRGKLYEKNNKIQEAFDSYEKALDFYEMDKSEMKGAIKEVKIAKANIICSNDMKDLIAEAKALFEEIGDDLIKNNNAVAGKILAKDYYFKKILCYFAYDDYISAKAYIDKYFGDDSSYESSPIGKLCNGIIKCFERGEGFKEEEDGITKVISTFKSSIRNSKTLNDKCVDVLLEKIKQKIYKDMEDDLNEEDDLR